MFMPLLNGLLKAVTFIVIVMTAFSVTIDMYDATHSGLIVKAFGLVASLAAIFGWFLLWKIGDLLFRAAGSQTFDEWFMDLVQG